MNIAFLKLRVADDAWLMIDRGAVLDSIPGRREPDWALVARSACHRARGAAASGIVAVDRDPGRNVARAWDRRGLPCPLFPSAALCAARWLFDAGLSASDAIVMESGGTETEVLVLDSRAFGMALGVAAGAGGSSLDAAPSRLLERPRSPAEGMGAATVRLRGRELRVRLFDGPPKAGVAGEGGAAGEVRAACVSRSLMTARRGGQDALLAAGAAGALASALDLAEAELTVSMAGDSILVQRPDGPGLFAAAEASYCLSGELWVPEAAEPRP